MDDRGVTKLAKMARRIILVGAIPLVIAINTVPFIIASKLKETDPYKEAMNLVRNHPDVIKYMGEPIEESRIRVTNKENYGVEGPDNNWFKIPISGPKMQGNVSVRWTYRTLANEEVKKLASAELELKQLPDYKLILKADKRETAEN